MKIGLRLRNCPITKLQNHSRGYILISLMLFFSLLAIAALAVLPDVAFQIKRDREEELIHRGVAYSRGVRRFFRKFGRYPSKIEDLEDTNGLRFIRKRYKDPVTGRDFKVLRMGDPQVASMMLGQVVGQGLQGQLGGAGALGGQGALGAIQGRGGAGSNPTQLIGQQTVVTKTDSSDATGGDSGNPPEGQAKDSPGTSSSPGSAESSDTSSPSQPISGGGLPMMGVVSTSRAQTIREFTHKNHYKDWLFIFDPKSDRGGMLNTPVQPGLTGQGFGGTPPQPVGEPGLPNSGAPGTVAPTPNSPNPGSQTPPEQ